MLERFQLSRYAGTPARHLPYGEQRRCERDGPGPDQQPPLFLLGAGPPRGGTRTGAEAEELIRVVRELKDEFRLTIILIEHQMRVVLNLCQRVTVLDFGCTIASGPPQEIQHHPTVLEAYLGREQSPLTERRRWSNEPSLPPSARG